MRPVLAALAASLPLVVIACNAMTGASEIRIVDCVIDCGLDSARDIEAGVGSAAEAGEASRPDSPETGSFGDASPEERSFARWPVTGDAGVVESQGTVTDNRTHLTWSETSTERLDSEDKAEAYCRGLPGGGWLLPSRIELASLLDHASSPAAPSWAKAAADTYWTYSRASAGPPVSYWGIDFLRGDLRSGAVTGRARCVRLPNPNVYPTGAHYDLFDQFSVSIVDRYTGLRWQRRFGSQMTWDAAKLYCQGLTVDNEQDWRLPSLAELVTIATDSANNAGAAVDVYAFPFTPGTIPFWTSTTLRTDASKAWVIEFDTGSTATRNSGELGYVRCVK